MTDTYISSYAADNNYAWDTSLIVRSSDAIASLLRFEISSIPTDATVLDAQLHLHVIGRSNSNALCVLPYAVLRPWVDAQANWNRAASGAPWAIPGCNGIGTDRSDLGGEEIWLRLTSTWYSLDVTGLVQGWVIDPVANYGLILRSVCHMGGAVEYRLAAANHPDSSLRPTLVVHYSTEGVPPTRTPTPAPTPTATPTPSTPLTVLTLQQGTDGYQWNADALIDWTSRNTMYGNDPILSIRGATSDQGYQDVHSTLVRFELYPVPEGALISSARLEIYLTARSNSGTAYISPYQVVRSWTESGVTWNRATSTAEWSIAGCNGIPADRLGDASDLVWPPPSTANVWVKMDVTAIVRNWIADSGTNKGVLLRAVGGNSVGYTFASSEEPDRSIRPRLVIEYWPGDGTSSTPTPTPTPTPTRPATPTPSTHTATIALKEGWNLVSIPVVPHSTDPAVLFAPIADTLITVYHWEAHTGEWKTYMPVLPPFASSLREVHERMGLWFKMEGAATLLVPGQLPATTQIVLHAGWNMVGTPVSEPRALPVALAKLDGKVTSVLTYDTEWLDGPWKRYTHNLPSSFNSLEVIQPGRGYWFFVTEACVWELAY